MEGAVFNFNWNVIGQLKTPTRLNTSRPFAKSRRAKKILSLDALCFQYDLATRENSGSNILEKAVRTRVAKSKWSLRLLKTSQIQ